MSPSFLPPNPLPKLHPQLKHITCCALPFFSAPCLEHHIDILLQTTSHYSFVSASSRQFLLKIQHCQPEKTQSTSSPPNPIPPSHFQLCSKPLAVASYVSMLYFPGDQADPSGTLSFLPPADPINNPPSSPIITSKCQISISKNTFYMVLRVAIHTRISESFIRQYTVTTPS